MIDFDLPKELIAQEPVRPRDSARLLVYNRKTKKIIDSRFYDLPEFLPSNTTMVVNNSKVEHCRWLFEGGSLEIFVIEKLDTHTIRALVRPGKRSKLGSKYSVNHWLDVETTAVDSDGIRTLKLSITHDDPRLLAVQHVPLPPYISQDDTLANEYQTIYAKPLGSKAAPTAGLHFTENLMSKIKKSHEIVEITLHVGLGTFAPLTQENITSGKLHSENYEISTETFQKISEALHVTAVGTTTTRTLESCRIKKTIVPLIRQTGDNSGYLQGETDIFIQPGYEFKRVDSMITNFHLPGTSLLLMVEAFVKSESELQRIYNHAIAEKYRFYSFGDGMLIL